MYKVPHYTENDRERIVAFMRENPFAVITGSGDTYPAATQVPLDIEVKDGKILLHGHIMKKSDHHAAFEKNNRVLVIFPGPHCYISASWYNQPLMASTWNYMSVHAKGRIVFGDETATVEAIRAITERFEGKDSAAAFDKLSSGYITSMVKAIVSFTIETESLDAVFKLSQNRDDASKQNIICQLKKKSDDDSLKIAEEMERRLRQ